MRLATLQAIVHTEFVPPGQDVSQDFFITKSLKGPEKGSFA